MSGLMSLEAVQSTPLAFKPVNAMPLQTPPVAPPLAGNVSFSSFIVDGVQGVSDKLIHADAMVRAFALDDSIPAHQVTFALEQARLSLELMMQVRNRLLEGYQQLMTMQL